MDVRDINEPAESHRVPSIREIYLAALEIVDTDDRRAFLQRACGDDPVRRARIEQLLAVGSAASESPLDRVLAPSHPPEMAPEMAAEMAAEMAPETAGEDLDHSLDGELSKHPTIDRYKLLEQIGQGGMGVVFMAEQTRPVRRKVALKLIKPGMGSREVIARFEAERQALAMMDHPHIARVLDAGSTADGQPYFVMELVRGIAITDYCDENRLTVRERLRLFVDVCHAVQHAHQKGVIHRDLKPSNILITLHDGTPVVKVIDFGVAKALDQELTDGTLFTRFAQMIGTPLYMSPEQAELSGLDVDTRSDIYSLGVVLYELLTGTTPFDRQSLMGEGLFEMRRILCEEEPLRPSHKISTLEAQQLSTVSNRRRSDPRQLSVALRRELDWIAMKSLEKDRNGRYESASAMSADVQRYLNDEPVEACSPTTGYKLRKVARRHRTALATAAAVLLALVGGSGVAMWQAVRATKAEQLAERRFEAADEAAQREKAARQQAEQASERARRLLSRSYVAAGTQRLEENDLARSLPWFVEALRVDIGDETLESLHRTRIAMTLQQCPTLIALFDTSSDNASSVALFDRHDRPIAVRVSDRGARVYDLESARPISPPLEVDDSITRVHLSPCGRYLHVITEAGQVLLEVETGREIFANTDTPDTRAWSHFSPDGRQLVVPPRNGRGYILDTQSGRELAALSARPEKGLLPRFSQDGKRLYWRVGNTPPTMSLWEAGQGTRTRQLSEYSSFLLDAQFSHDGNRIVTASFDTHARIYDVDSMRPITPAMDHDDYVQRACFSPDDTMVLTVSGDHTARLWDAESGQPLTPPLRHDSELKDGAFSRDGRYVVTASWDTTARIWETATGSLAYPILTHHTQVASAAFDALGRRVITITTDGLVHVWDLAGGRPPAMIIDDAQANFTVEFSPDGQKLLTAGSGGRLWNSETGEPLSPLLTHDEQGVRTAAFGMQGRRIATANPGGARRVWNAETFEPLSPLIPHHWERGSIWNVFTPSLGPDGQILAVFRHPVRPGELRIWDGQTGALLPWPVAETEHILDAVYSRDGKFIATGRATSGSMYLKGGALRLWDGRTGRPLGEPIEHDFPVWDVTFSRDGRSIASRSGVLDSGIGEARVFDVKTGNPLGPPIRIGSELNGLDFSPDGTRLVTAARDQTVQIWDVASGKPLTPPIFQLERLEHVRFSPDGRFVLTTAGVENLNSQGPANVRLWDAATGQPIAPPLRHSDPTQIVTSGCFSPDGERMATVSRDRTTRIWTLAHDERPCEDLMLLAGLLSSRKLDGVGSLAPTSAEEKLAAWKQLRSRYPKTFTALPRQVLAWRHSEAVDCLKKGCWQESLIHLNALIDALPEANLGLYQRRIECAAALEAETTQLIGSAATADDPQ